MCGPRSSCCLCAHRPSARQDPCRRWAICTWPDWMETEEGPQRPRLRMALAVPPSLTCPPPACPAGFLVRYSLKSQLPLRWSPGPPTSTLPWPQVGQSLALALLSPQARWARCKVAYLLSFDSFIKTCTYATGRSPLLSEPTPSRAQGAELLSPQSVVGHGEETVGSSSEL